MRYFSNIETSTFLPVLQDTANSYNNTYHRTIEMRPADVKDSNQEEVRISTLLTLKNGYKTQTLQIDTGALCTYMIHMKIVFTRAYDGTYSGEMFKSDRCTLPIYRLRDLQDEGIKGKFYQSELQEVDVDPNKTWKVEKVAKDAINKTSVCQVEVPPA